MSSGVSSWLLESRRRKVGKSVRGTVLDVGFGTGISREFYPDGVPGAEVMANANTSGGLELAKDYWVSFPDGYRAHQIRLEGGDCSTDSFCYPSV